MRIVGDRVLISPLPARELSTGGIVLPQGQAGDVMFFWKAKQLGTQWSKPEVAVGDTLITPLHFSHTTLPDGTKIVDADQFIGKLESDPFVPDV